MLNFNPSLVIYPKDKNAGKFVYNYLQNHGVLTEINLKGLNDDEFTKDRMAPVTNYLNSRGMKCTYLGVGDKYYGGWCYYIYYDKYYESLKLPAYKTSCDEVHEIAKDYYQFEHFVGALKRMSKVNRIIEIELFLLIWSNNKYGNLIKKNITFNKLSLPSSKLKRAINFLKSKDYIYIKKISSFSNKYYFYILSDRFNWLNSKTKYYVHSKLNTNNFYNECKNICDEFIVINSKL